MRVARRRGLAAGGGVLSLGLAGCATAVRELVSEPDIAITVVNRTSIHRTVAVIVSSETGNDEYSDGVITVKRGERETFDDEVDLGDSPPNRPVIRVLVDDGTFEERALTIETSGELVITVDDGVSIEKRWEFTVPRPTPSLHVLVFPAAT